MITSLIIGLIWLKKSLIDLGSGCMSKVDYEIVLANEEDRTEILSLYDMQKGREFCPWSDDYP